MFSNENVSVSGRKYIIFQGFVFDIVDEFIYMGVKMRCNGIYKKNYALQQGNKSMLSLISKCEGHPTTHFSNSG